MNLHSLATSLNKLRNQIAPDFHLTGSFDANRRSAIRELTAMTDRDLHDMGIFRADIENVVRYGRP